MVAKKRALPHPLKRIVVKIGTRALSQDGGGLAGQRLDDLGADVAEARRRGIDVIVVSSGAVGLGLDALRRDLPLAAPGARRPIVEKQALAAVGQGRLMEAWRRALSPQGLHVAQVLLTREDLERRKQYFNARNTLEQLLRWRVVPIINENDTTANEEIKYGDNDGLAAIVALKLRADLLVLLTNMDGICDADPRTNPTAKLLEDLDRVTPELIERLGGASPSKGGSGGVASKLSAARAASEGGAAVVIANGMRPGALKAILSGEFEGTFVAGREEGRRLNSTRVYLQTETTSASRLIRVNAGAVEALLKRGASLLPAGVVAVEGRFEAGEAVRVLGPEGELVAKGVASYSSRELETLKGKRAAQIAEALGYENGAEAIHRDAMLLLASADSNPAGSAPAKAEEERPAGAAP
jgi:glutamate 5-kinase